MLSHTPWRAIAGLRHGFLDRAECSADPWPTVLAGAGETLPIVVPRQVHGKHVVAAELGAAPEADAVVTARPGVLVGVVTADCVPVLLVDATRRAAAAVHAGWRGAAAGVLEAAVEELRGRFGSDPGSIEAAVGPAIAGCCYEVGHEVLDAFRARTGDLTRPAWTMGPRREHLDLRIAADLLLRAAGVRTVHVLGPCTACGAGYHSFRRDGAGVGRQLSFVGWA